VTEPPVLWHLKVSHFNEKVRWALDYKGVEHLRRAGMPGPHRSIARKLTGGETFPVLVVDGEAIGDSTRIIAELERRHPHPPLYPADPRSRARALELEEHFDENFGPDLRLLVLHATLPEPDLMLATFAPDLLGFRRLAARAIFPRIKSRVVADFGMDEERVELAYERVRAGGGRFRTELQPSGYLVGERFTVADLTVAALAGPAVAPEQWPYPQPQRGHARLAPLRDALAESGLLEWTRDVYARHRGASSELAA
jgi:glutathione S-transferase